MESFTLKVVKSSNGKPIKLDEPTEVVVVAEFSFSTREEAEANLNKFREVLVAINANEYGFSASW